MLDMSIHADVKALERKLSEDLAYRQMPFATATATALTSLNVHRQDG